MPLDMTSIVTLGVVVLGGVGWLFKRWLRSRDEARKKKRAFNTFLRTWKTECDVSELERVSLAYEARKVHFITEIETVRDYIKDKARFDALCKKVSTCRHNAGQSQENRGEFMDAIVELFAFVESE